MEKTILFVDNDIFTSRIITKLLSGLYRLVIRKTADEAMKDIENGLNPAIVMSSRVLKGLDGLEFLSFIDKKFPKSFTILITAEKDPKLLLDYIKKSKVDLFLTKPFNSLQLIQILKLGINKYSSSEQKDNEQGKNTSKPVSNSDNIHNYQDELIECQDKLNQTIENFKITQNDQLKHIVRVISNLIVEAERFYFRNHTLDVVETCRSVSSMFKLNENEQKNLLYASLLHNHHLIGMPDLLKCSNPSELSEVLKKEFFIHLLKSTQNLSQIQAVSKYVNYASMMFENVAGTGEPNKLTGLNIPKEIQFLSMVNLYHNLVYRVRSEDLKILKVEGELIQSRAVTIKRHQEAITFFYKNIKQFDHDLFYKFQELIKKREINSLQFNEKDLVIKYDKNKYVSPLLSKDEKEDYLSKKLFAKRSKIFIKNETGQIVDSFIEEEGKISDLKPGMTTTKAILTYDEMQVLPPLFEHTQDSIDKLHQRFEKELISEIVYIRRELDNKIEDANDDDKMI